MHVLAVVRRVRDAVGNLCLLLSGKKTRSMLPSFLNTCSIVSALCLAVARTVMSPLHLEMDMSHDAALIPVNTFKA